MDDELVWHGGMNLLGKADAWDNNDDEASFKSTVGNRTGSRQ